MGCFVLEVVGFVCVERCFGLSLDVLCFNVEECFWWGALARLLWFTGVVGTFAFYFGLWVVTVLVGSCNVLMSWCVLLCIVCCGYGVWWL